MKYLYDYLIVGSGLFGSVFARQMTDAGKKCLIIDKRNHIGGNCYTEQKHGDIHVHKYGPHIFHTNNQKIWKYVKRFITLNNFQYRPKVNYDGQIYSFPINLMTMNQMWGVSTPAEAETLLASKRVPIENPSNLEEWILSQVGEELYQTFVYGYTKKQWGMHPNELPKFIIQRLPIRLTFNDNYFDDKYQGIPTKGYTQLFHSLHHKIEVWLNADYFKAQSYYDSLATKVVYTGPIDRFFDYTYGDLGWRSLRFEEADFSMSDFQGVATVNHTHESVPYTRTVEHKHFTYSTSDSTIVTYEYPQNYSRGEEPYYPINNDANNNILAKYKCLIDPRKYIFGGRLANYQYYDMHQVIGAALAASDNELLGRNP